MYYYKSKEELLKRNEIAISQKQLQTLLLDLHSRLKLNQFHGYYFDRARAGDKNMKSICNASGAFRCQGRWDKNDCLYHPAHSINPYLSREARIVFQTWNLDHNKERSRSIIPAICTALRVCGTSRRDFDYTDNGRGRNVENGRVRRRLNGQSVSPSGQRVKILCIEDRNITEGEEDDYDEIDRKNLRLDVQGIYDDLFTTANLKLVHIVCHDKGAHTSSKAGPYLVGN